MGVDFLNLIHKSILRDKSSDKVVRTCREASGLVRKHLQTELADSKHRCASSSFFSVVLSSPELSDTNVYKP